MKPIILMALVMLCSCNSAFVKLPSELRDPEYGPLMKRWDAMPKHTFRFEVEKGHRLAVTEVGAGSREHAIVCISGFMSDWLAWRYIGGALGPEHRMLLIDPPGCGLSDAPDGRKPDAWGCCRYCPVSQARAILEGMRQRLAREPARRLTMVGHSLGGAIILRMWADPTLRNEYADVLQRVDGLVLFAPVDVAINKDQPDFTRIEKLTAMQVQLGDVLGVLEQSVADGIRDSVVEQHRAGREEALRIAEIFRDPAKLQAGRWMLRRTVPIVNGRPDWEKIEQITEGYGRVSPPCLIVWGSRDQTLPESMGHKLLTQLPNARLRVVQKSMHCLPVERPMLCANLIRQAASDPGSSVARVEWIDGMTGRIVRALSHGTAALPELPTDHRHSPGDQGLSSLAASIVFEVAWRLFVPSPAVASVTVQVFPARAR